MKLSSAELPASSFFAIFRETTRSKSAHRKELHYVDVRKYGDQSVRRKRHVIFRRIRRLSATGKRMLRVRGLRVRLRSFSAQTLKIETGMQSTSRTTPYAFIFNAFIKGYLANSRPRRCRSVYDKTLPHFTSGQLSIYFSSCFTYRIITKITD